MHVAKPYIYRPEQCYFCSRQPLLYLLSCYYRMEEDDLVEEIPAHVIDRIQKAIQVMNDYKMEIINKTTLRTQNPTELNNVNIRLRRNSILTKNYISTGQVPENSDEGFKAYIARLSENLTPWNPDVSTQVRYWCVRIFEDGTFSPIVPEGMPNSNSIMPI
jgi:hypothetical protein